MASALSFELFEAKQGVANGIATLDATTKIPSAQLPAEAISAYKGTFATSGDLPGTGTLGDYAYVTETTSYWYWNSALTTPAWVNQQITESAYDALSDSEKAAVPYVVIPNP